MQLTRSGVEAATVANLGIGATGKSLARTRIPRPGHGHCSEAVTGAVTKVLIWRDRETTDRFHVMVFGCEGREHCVDATQRPVPDEILSATVAAAGFPIGTTVFQTKPMSDRGLRMLEMWRNWVLGGSFAACNPSLSVGGAA